MTSLEYGKETNLITLTRHSIHDQSKHSNSRGEMTLLLTSIQLGCKFVSTAVRKAGLANMTGLAGNTNVQGEEQKKLDVIANDIFINALKSSGTTALMVSEENEEAILVEDSMKGKYIVVFDPLDGSSNIDCGVSIGTIFGIYRLAEGSKGEIKDALRPGSEMVAAGYASYGSSTILVLSTGAEVNGYTLDPSLGEFILTHPNIQIPNKCKIYSINEGNTKKWDQATAEYIQSCKERTFSLRYIGSMVADVHRTFLYGGVFAYPGDKGAPKGKLRLLYEVFPMSFLCEKAGGMATTGRKRVLDIVPESLHERCPLWLGSKSEIEAVVECFKKMDEAGKA